MTVLFPAIEEARKIFTESLRREEEGRGRVEGRQPGQPRSVKDTTFVLGQNSLFFSFFFLSRHLWRR